MGGVDLLDGLIGRYKIRMRSKKWYMRLFYHLVDIAIINSWLLYRRVNRSRSEKSLPLAKFRADIANCLCNVGIPSSSKRGRPVAENLRRIFKPKNSAPLRPHTFHRRMFG